MLTTDAARLELGQFLRAGDRIVWGQACGEPTTLVEALIAQAESIGGLSAFAATSFSGILDVAAAEKLAISSMGAIGELRTLTAAHRLSIIPCHVSQVGVTDQRCRDAHGRHCARGVQASRRRPVSSRSS
jgi:acyl-CoA hydrolase